MTTRETPDENPNYFIRNLKKRIAPVQVTQFPHPYPQLKGITKQQLRYKRADGVDLTATLYLPVFRLGEDLAVRLPRHRASVQSLESEIRCIGQLGERWTFPTQRIVRVGKSGAEYPWSWAVTSWLPGELAADRPLDAAEAPALGRALAEIHQPAPADAPYNSEQSIRLAAREPVYREVLPRLLAAAAPRGLEVDLDATAFLWRRASVLPDDAPPVWIHADLHPFNVISLGGRFGGIIDWSDISGEHAPGAAVGRRAGSSSAWL